MPVLNARPPRGKQLLPSFLGAICLCALSMVSCKEGKKGSQFKNPSSTSITLQHAKGFEIKKMNNGITVITITDPWPNADVQFTYALVPREKMATIELDVTKYDVIVPVPVNKIVVTSTTHIPVLEALGVEQRLIGFPNLDFISSEKTRARIKKGDIMELGNNESINTEMVLALDPDLVVGFGINNRNTAYETVQKSQIPVVYNGDWAEETPLGKAEWIKFMAPFFQLEEKADIIFKNIERSYMEAVQLAKNAKRRPTVLTGGLYKDVWYVSGGKSWMAEFLNDAHAHYLWKDTKETGSLSLGLENVYLKGRGAEYWLNPSLHRSYGELEMANGHYAQFRAFKEKRVYSITNSLGDTGGMVFYELGPNRPDLVLKDLIHIFHPELLPNHQLFFFKPLK